MKPKNRFNTLHFLITITILAFALHTSYFAPVHAQSPSQPDINSLLQIIDQRLTHTSNRISTSSYPESAAKGAHRWNLGNASRWTSGFFPGQMWIMYQHTGDDKWKTQAQNWTNNLENEKNNTRTHDLGFKLFNSFGKGYLLTNNQHYRQVVLDAATTYTKRYNAKVGAFGSNWGSDNFPMIIDIMMNLEMLLWAAAETQDTALYDKVITHADTAIRDLIRSDGSTYQLVDYNPNTGKIIKKDTLQGYDDDDNDPDDTTWSRGQAWGIYGFTMMYRETNEQRYLDTAIKLADYFINNLPADYVPFYDFQDPRIPSSNVPRDSSAAAIVASALLELHQYLDHPDQQQYYYNTALHILKSLTSDYWAPDVNDQEILLVKTTHNINTNKYVDGAAIYASYYFQEALYRLHLLNPLAPPQGLRVLKGQ